MWFVLAVLLAVSQAPSPAPRKAPDNPAGTGRPANSQPKTDKAPATPPEAPVDMVAPEKHKDSGKDVSKENAQQPVRIGELPAVSVEKDWTDYSYWFFSFFLAGVAGYQAWLLRGTLRQTEIAAQAANRSADVADKTLVQTQRAFVNLKSVNATRRVAASGGALIGFKIDLEWVNCGSTPALQVKIESFLHIVGINEEPDDLAQRLISAPQCTIGPGGTITSSLGPHISFDKAKEMKTTPNILATIHGLVEYRDVFSRTPVRRTEVFLSVKPTGADYEKANGGWFIFAPTGPRNTAD